MRSCFEQRIFFVANQAIDLFARKCVEIDLAGSRVDCGFWRRECRRDNRWRAAAHVRHHQSCDLPDRARAHETRGRKSDADRCFERVFNFDAHQ